MQYHYVLKVFIFQHCLKLTAPVNNNQNDISCYLRKAELANYSVKAFLTNNLCEK